MPVALRRKKRSLVVAGLLCGTGCVLGICVYLAGVAPEFYRRVDGLPHDDRMENARQFVRQSSSIWNQIENDARWSGSFRESQINAWLAGDFARKHAGTLPAGLSEPRVCIDRDRVALAFRAQQGPIQVVVSAQGQLWLAEPNLIALKLESVRAGLIPIPAAAVLRTVSRAAESAGLSVEWRQHGGHAVALIRLGDHDSSSKISLDQLLVGDGRVHLAGRSRTREPRSHSAAHRERDSRRE